MSLPKDVAALAGLFAVSGVIHLVNPPSPEDTRWNARTGERAPRWTRVKSHSDSNSVTNRGDCEPDDGELIDEQL